MFKLIKNGKASISKEVAKRDLQVELLSAEQDEKDSGVYEFDVKPIRISVMVSTLLSHKFIGKPSTRISGTVSAIEVLDSSTLSVRYKVKFDAPHTRIYGYEDVYLFTGDLINAKVEGLDIATIQALQANDRLKS